MTAKRRNFSRRDFIAGSVAGLSGAGLLTLTGKAAGASPSKQDRPESQAGPISRSLGKTGIKLPIVNMGVMNSMNPALVKRAYDLGMRHYDTAAWYQRGQNERMVGQALKEMNARDKVVIATKIYIPVQQRAEMTPTQAKKAYLRIAGESLKRLQTDYIDILYSHNVYDREWLYNPGIIEALQLLKEQKKARHIGFTTHANMGDCLNEVSEKGIYEVVLTAINYSMSDDKLLFAAMKKAFSSGIGLIAMKTQCKQPWYKEEYEPAGKGKFYTGPILHTALLKWVLRNEFITTSVPGFTTFEEQDEDFSVAFSLDYTPEEKKFLEDRNVIAAMGSVCTQCSRCVPTCPAGADIPNLMRTHMYAAAYANFFQARDTLDEIPRKKGLEACLSCKQCQARCAKSVNIRSRINTLKLIYV